MRSRHGAGRTWIMLCADERSPTRRGTTPRSSTRSNGGFFRTAACGTESSRRAGRRPSRRSRPATSAGGGRCARDGRSAGSQQGRPSERRTRPTAAPKRRATKEMDARQARRWTRRRGRRRLESARVLVPGDVAPLGDRVLALAGDEASSKGGRGQLAALPRKAKQKTDGSRRERRIRAAGGSGRASRGAQSALASSSLPASGGSARRGLPASAVRVSLSRVSSQQLWP